MLSNPQQPRLLIPLPPATGSRWPLTAADEPAAVYPRHPAQLFSPWSPMASVHWTRSAELPGQIPLRSSGTAISSHWDSIAAEDT